MQILINNRDAQHKIILIKISLLEKLKTGWEEENMSFFPIQLSGNSLWRVQDLNSEIDNVTPRHKLCPIVANVELSWMRMQVSAADAEPQWKAQELPLPLPRRL